MFCSFHLEFDLRSFTSFLEYITFNNTCNSRTSCINGVYNVSLVSFNYSVCHFLLTETRYMAQTESVDHKLTKLDDTNGLENLRNSFCIACSVD